MQAVIAHACHGHTLQLCLEVSEREEDVVALHLPIGLLKNPAVGWNRYRDANPVPTSLLADGNATAPSGPVLFF